MDTKNKNQIQKDTQKNLPYFNPAPELQALNNSNIYLMRYFPKLKMIVLTEQFCTKFHLQPVYYDMPESFSKAFANIGEQEKFEQTFRDINAGMPSVSVDFRGKNEMTWYRITTTTIEWDNNQKPELCTCVIEDRTEENLIREELDNILSSISCGILQYRQLDNTLLRANKAALNILGYDTPEELSADRENGIVRNVLPEDRSHIKELIDSLKYPGELKTVEYRVQHKNSEQIRYCFGTIQVYDDIHGERIVQRTLMDITDRKQKEDMQHTNNKLLQQLDTIMNGISGGFEIMQDDADFTYLSLNESVAALQGYSVSELLKVCNGNSLENIYPDDRDYVIKELRNVACDGRSYTIKYRLRHKNGTLIWVSKTGKKIIDNDGTTLHYCLVQDITESLKRMEELNHLLTMQRHMITSLSCGVFAYTLPEREILVQNNEAKRIFHYKDNDSKSLIDTMFDYISPKDLTELHNAIVHLKNTGDCCTYRLHPQMENGRRLTVECFTKLLAFDDGKQFILSVLSDITKAERQTRELNELNIKQTQLLAKIHRERQQYRDALVSGSEYSYRFDVMDGIIRSDFDDSTRRGLMEQLNLTSPVNFDEMMQRWVDLIKPEFLTPKEQNPLTTAQLQECYERGLKHIVTEYYNKNENKYYRRIFLLSMDEDTQHLWAIAIVNDITNIIREETRKRNELIMINRDLRNQISISKAFSSIYFASWEINLENRLLTGISLPKWAKNFERISNSDLPNTIEMMITSFVKEEARDSVRKFVCIDDMAKRLKNKNILICEYQGSHYGWFNACLIPFMWDDNGNILRVILALREISAEKRMELRAKQALEEAYENANRANAAKTDFLSSVSHDIRTPMNGIIGMTAIASSHLDDRERVADCLNKISLSSRHLLGLINEVLDMNKLESGKMDLNVEKFNLCELIDTLLVMTKPQLESKKHQLSINIHDLEHEKVIGDSSRIQQVFVNLLGNSIKYTPDGGFIRLSLSEKTTNNPKIGCFEFIVEDNGIGMSEEFQKHLFEPFSRADDMRIQKIQGTGLGMAISRNIVRMMNGDIKVESKLSKGSRFIVTIYLELQENDNDTTINILTNQPVLVVDNDRITCENACTMLEKLHMKSEWTLTCKDAIQKAASRHKEGNDYFAILLDQKIPDIDDMQAVETLRKTIGEKVLIIIMSAYDWSDIEQKAKSAGANAFISKPLFKSRLSHLFGTLLDDGLTNLNNSGMNTLAEKNFKGKRALLTEDNELNAEIATELLGITGLELDYARNGKEAVNLVAGHPQDYYDIIFMDIQMPIMNGYEAAKAIRSLPGAYEKRVPIIAMTANAFAEDVQSAKNAGMNGHIAKPLNITQLIKTLEHWLL